MALSATVQQGQTLVEVQ